MAKRWLILAGILLLAGCASKPRPMTQRELDSRLVELSEIGDLAGMEKLIRHGADLNAKNAAGLTPYAAAYRGGQVEAMGFLETRGARAVKPDGEKRPVPPQVSSKAPPEPD